MHNAALIERTIISILWESGDKEAGGIWDAISAHQELIGGEEVPWESFVSCVSAVISDGAVTSNESSVTKRSVLSVTQPLDRITPLILSLLKEFYPHPLSLDEIMLWADAHWSGHGITPLLAATATRKLVGSGVSLSEGSQYLLDVAEPKQSVSIVPSLRLKILRVISSFSSKETPEVSLTQLKNALCSHDGLSHMVLKQLLSLLIGEGALSRNAVKQHLFQITDLGKKLLKEMPKETCNKQLGDSAKDVIEAKINAALRGSKEGLKKDSEEEGTKNVRTEKMIMYVMKNLNQSGATWITFSELFPKHAVESAKYYGYSNYASCCAAMSYSLKAYVAIGIVECRDVAPGKNGESHRWQYRMNPKYAIDATGTLSMHKDSDSGLRRSLLLLVIYKLKTMSNDLWAVQNGVFPIEDRIGVLSSLCAEIISGLNSAEKTDVG